MRTHSPQREDWLDEQIAVLRETVERREARPAVPRKARYGARNGGRSAPSPGSGLQRRLARVRWALRRRLPGLLAYTGVLVLTVAVGWLIATHT